MRDLKHTRLLEGMLGVCSVCKNIRNPHSSEWEPLESYIRTHPKDFQPDVCPDCGVRIGDVMFDRR
jgi:hypothetical protein